MPSTAYLLIYLHFSLLDYPEIEDDDTLTCLSGYEWDDTTRRCIGKKLI